MSVLKALMVAVSVAERKRDEARQVLQNAQAACQAAQGQLSQLEGYAEEIQERWGAKEGASLKPEVMYHHHQFMGRLGHAAGLQSGVVADHLQRIEAALEGRQWIAGGHPTIADVALYSYIDRAPEGNVDRSTYTNIAAWLKRIEALPGFVAFQKTPIGIPEAA